MKVLAHKEHDYPYKIHNITSHLVISWSFSRVTILPKGLHMSAGMIQDQVWYNLIIFKIYKCYGKMFLFIFE